MTIHFKPHLKTRLIKHFLCLMLIIIFALTSVKLYLTSIYFPHEIKKNSLLNFTDFHYIISSDLCAAKNIFLLILIHSAPNHFRDRNLIRNTWGNPDSRNHKNVKVVFLLAAAPEFQSDIESESRHFKDIVQGNFIDSYRNLTYKHAMGLKWAVENCAHANMIMKMDDDIFIDVFQFLQFITEHLSPMKLINKVACFVQRGMPVVRDPVSKWYVSKTEYTKNVFENYCSGWAYITSIHVAQVLLKSLQKLNYFWVDDVHVTGTAAKIANIFHIEINDLFDLESDGLVEWSATKEKVKWNKMFAPTWGDLELSRIAYIKTLICWVKNCTCCYSRKTIIKPTQTPTTQRGVVKLVSL